MTDLILWLAPALLVFWSVGAYNRLVRLRGEVKAAFASVDAELQRHVQLAQDLPDDDENLVRVRGAMPMWTQVHAATAQLVSSLDAARARPLDPQAVAALRAAADVFETAWQRVEREDAHDLAGPRLPEVVLATRVQLVVQAQAAGSQFNEAVARYNQAIAQFPAILLSWIFGFKPAQPL